jgi:hypothetical protein
LAQALHALLHPELNPNGVFSAEALFAAVGAGAGAGAGAKPRLQSELSEEQQVVEVAAIVARLFTLGIIEHAPAPPDLSDATVCSANATTNCQDVTGTQPN